MENKNILMQPWSVGVDDIFAEFKTSHEGLTEKEASFRQDVYGKN